MKFELAAFILSLLASGACAASDPHHMMKGGRRGKMALTTWFVVFNAPEHCVTNPNEEAKCGAVDLFGQAYIDSILNNNPDPSLIVVNTAAEIGVIYGNGGVTKRNGDFNVIASMWRMDDPIVSDANVDPLQLNKGWTNPSAEIHIVIRSHDKAVRKNDGYLAQVTNFLDPYCEDPWFGYTGDQFNGNLCTDIQDIVAAPDVSGELPVGWMLSGGRQVDGARATFNRRGDLTQAVIETNVRCPKDFDGCYDN